MSDTSISENTKIRLGAVAALFMVLVAAVAWGSALQAKVDSIITILTPQKTTIEDHERRILKAEFQIQALTEKK